MVHRKSTAMLEMLGGWGLHTEFESDTLRWVAVFYKSCERKRRKQKKKGTARNILQKEPDQHLKHASHSSHGIFIDVSKF